MSGTATSAPRAAPRALQAPATLAAVAAGSVGLLAAVDPNTSGIYPACPSLSLFGVYCPFCGGLRGMHALTQGDLPAMVSSNALLPGILVLAAWGWLAWVMRLVSGRSLAPPRLGNGSWVALGGVAVVYGILRNVPGFEMLAP